jgi:vitamin B12 transporter
VVLSLQGQQQWAHESDSNGYSDALFLDTSDGVTANVRMGSAFVESQTSIDDRLFLNVGGRWDDHSQYGVHTTYQAGLAYFIPGLETKLKVTYGTGFLAPSLYQLYDPTYGNNGLLPETSKGYDIGVEQPLGSDVMKIGATYFHNEFDNLIDFNFITLHYYNIDIATTDGVESFIEFKGVRNLEFRASYTYLNTLDNQTGLALLLRPQNQVDLSTDYRWDKAELGISVSYTGSRDDLDLNGNPVILPPYFLVHLRASYELSGGVKVFARVDNLFNQYYEQVFGYSTPGLSAYGGIKLSY